MERPQPVGLSRGRVRSERGGDRAAIAAIEVGFFQRLLETTALSGSQWFVVIGLSLLAPLVIGVDRWLELRRALPGAAQPSNPVVSAVGER